MDEPIPTVPCERSRDGLHFVIRGCPFRGRDHYHAAEPGHRVAHCPSDLAPNSGYILKLTDAELRRV